MMMTDGEKMFLFLSSIVGLLLILLLMWTLINDNTANGLCREIGLNKSIDRLGLQQVQCNDNHIYTVVCFPNKDKWGYDTIDKRCYLFK
jgi:hypothetical protein